MQLLITQCKDPQLWYAKLVGQKVPLIRKYRDGYLALEPDGYTNMVAFCDAEVIDDKKGEAPDAR